MNFLSENANSFSGKSLYSSACTRINEYTNNKWRYKIDFNERKPIFFSIHYLIDIIIKGACFRNIDNQKGNGKFQ